MAEKVNLKAYFERIGFAGSIAPTLTTLELLHALHPAVIPFENLTPLMGDPVKLDQPSLEKKLLIDKRGGYCFEHDLLFMRMLADLDYVVRPLLARVVWTNPEGAQLPPSHLLLLVEISGQNYIADVGFGGLTLTTPLRLRADVEQATPHETFRLTGGDPDWTLEVRIDDVWKPVYVFTLNAVSEADIAPINHDIATASPFTFELRVALARSGRRLKLHNRNFSIQPTGGDKEEREINTMDELRALLIGEFGIAVPDDDRLDAALAKLLPPPPAPADTPTE
jgi:N-hydroxyarylamine O-acetyltransferase